MPTWLIPLIKLAIQIGSPYLLGLISKWIGGLSPETQQFIADVIAGFKNPHIPNSDVKREAHARLKACVGVACEPDTKNDG